MELTFAKYSKFFNSTKVKAWLRKAMLAFIKARQQEANRRISMMQLRRMTDYELRDIGMNRCDIKRRVYEK